MAITNYTTLKVAIEEWSHRSDVVSLIDDFIDLTEAQLWKHLKIKEMDTRVQSAASTSDRFLTLPSNYLQYRKIVLISGGVYYPLMYKTPEAMQVMSSSGRPKFFTVTSEVEFDRIPDSAYTVEHQYYAKLDSLSSSNLTNAVITNYPSLYLWGGLWHLWAWATDIEKSEHYRNLFFTSISEINKKETASKYGPAPAARVEGSTP